MTEITENTSDGYHTFKELYEFRLLLNAALFNSWASGYNYDRDRPYVCKSRLHSDGTIPFNDPNWFIVVAVLTEGQISFHYEMKDWELFDIPEVPLPPKYDGHTAADVAVRLRRYLERS
ncbi:hypothetical protein SEA_PAELLA_185 [Arthrobacter phage Paella]|nr:hypothetical protein SEA_PAELLA_185 [Arthrobacter phage Paella]